MSEQPGETGLLLHLVVRLARPGLADYNETARRLLDAAKTAR